VPGLKRSGHDAGVTCEGTDSRWKQRADARPVSTKLTDYWRALGSRTRAGRWHAGGTPQGGAAGTRGQAAAHAGSGGRETPAALTQARRRAGTRSVATGGGDLRRTLKASTTRGKGRQAATHTGVCVGKLAGASGKRADSRKPFPAADLTGQSALEGAESTARLAGTCQQQRPRGRTQHTRQGGQWQGWGNRTPQDT
jgi:hypothetical protein